MLSNNPSNQDIEKDARTEARFPEASKKVQFFFNRNNITDSRVKLETTSWCNDGMLQNEQGFQLPLHTHHLFDSSLSFTTEEGKEVTSIEELSQFTGYDFTKFSQLTKCRKEDKELYNRVMTLQMACLYPSSLSSYKEVYINNEETYKGTHKSLANVISRNQFKTNAYVIGTNNKFNPTYISNLVGYALTYGHKRINSLCEKRDQGSAVSVSSITIDFDAHNCSSKKVKEFQQFVRNELVTLPIKPNIMRTLNGIHVTLVLSRTISIEQALRLKSLYMFYLMCSTLAKPDFSYMNLSSLMRLPMTLQKKDQRKAVVVFTDWNNFYYNPSKLEAKLSEFFLLNIEDYVQMKKDKVLPRNFVIDINWIRNTYSLNFEHRSGEFYEALIAEDKKYSDLSKSLKKGYKKSSVSKTQSTKNAEQFNNNGIILPLLKDCSSSDFVDYSHTNGNVDKSMESFSYMRENPLNVKDLSLPLQKFYQQVNYTFIATDLSSYQDKADSLYEQFSSCKDNIVNFPQAVELAQATINEYFVDTVYTHCVKRRKAIRSPFYNDRHPSAIFNGHVLHHFRDDKMDYDGIQLVQHILISKYPEHFHNYKSLFKYAVKLIAKALGYTVIEEKKNVISLQRKRELDLEAYLQYAREHVYQVLGLKKDEIQLYELVVRLCYENIVKSCFDYEEVQTLLTNEYIQEKYNELYPHKSLSWIKEKMSLFLKEGLFYRQTKEEDIHTSTYSERRDKSHNLANFISLVDLKRYQDKIIERYNKMKEYALTHGKKINRLNANDIVEAIGFNWAKVIYPEAKLMKNYEVTDWCNVNTNEEVEKEIALYKEQVDVVNNYDLVRELRILANTDDSELSVKRLKRKMQYHEYFLKTGCRSFNIKLHTYLTNIFGKTSNVFNMYGELTQLDRFRMYS